MHFRPAISQDAPQLAELIHIADQAHYPTSGYAFSIGGTRTHQIDELTKLIHTHAPSQFHYSHFDVAVTRDGVLAASVAAFDRTDANSHLRGALKEIGWTNDHIDTLGEQLAPFDGSYPEDEPGSWTIEHVATLASFRGQGLIHHLLAQAIERGRTKGFTLAVVDVFDGNRKAQAVYEAAGFRPITAFGHVPLRQIFNRDPLIRCQRSIG